MIMERNTITEVCAPGRAPSLFRDDDDARESRVQSGILFTLSIHTRGTFVQAGSHVSIPKKTEGMSDSAIQESRLPAFNYARCLIDRLARKQKIGENNDKYLMFPQK